MRQPLTSSPMTIGVRHDPVDVIPRTFSASHFDSRTWIFVVVSSMNVPLIV